MATWADMTEEQRQAMVARYPNIYLGSQVAASPAEVEGDSGLHHMSGTLAVPQPLSRSTTTWPAESFPDAARK